MVEDECGLTQMLLSPNGFNRMMNDRQYAGETHKVYTR